MMVRIGSRADSGARTPPRRTIRCASKAAAGRALRFTGASFVRLPDSELLAPASLTAEAVVRAPASPGQWRYIISRGSQGCTAGAYGIYTAAAGGLAIYVFDGARYIVSAAARAEDVWNGAWHHVAGTFDGRALRLFVDGRPSASRFPRRWSSTTPQPPPTPPSANTPAAASSASKETSTSCGCGRAPDPPTRSPPLRSPGHQRAVAPARCPPPRPGRCSKARPRRRAPTGPAACASCARSPPVSAAPSSAYGSPSAAGLCRPPG